MLKGKDIFTFVRFGGLDLKNQKGFSNNPETYHQPPASRGFYAMPKIAQELFLVGSLESTQPGVFAKDGKNVENYWRDKLRQIRKEFRKTEGEIWHHLEEYTDHKDVLQRNGSWIKTDIKVWSKSFSKMSTKMKWGRSKEMSGEIYPRGITGIYSKDHCEVFFDEKV